MFFYWHRFIFYIDDSYSHQMRVTYILSIKISHILLLARRANMRSFPECLSHPFITHIILNVDIIKCNEMIAQCHKTQ